MNAITNKPTTNKFELPQNQKGGKTTTANTADQTNNNRNKTNLGKVAIKTGSAVFEIASRNNTERNSPQTLNSERTDSSKFKHYGQRLESLLYQSLPKDFDPSVNLVHDIYTKVCPTDPGKSPENGKKIGTTAGTVIGGCLGGPPGAVIGGAAVGAIGSLFDNNKKKPIKLGKEVKKAVKNNKNWDYSDKYTLEATSEERDLKTRIIYNTNENDIKQIPGESFGVALGFLPMDKGKKDGEQRYIPVLLKVKKDNGEYKIDDPQILAVFDKNNGITQEVPENPLTVNNKEVIKTINRKLS